MDGEGRKRRVKGPRRGGGREEGEEGRGGWVEEGANWRDVYESLVFSEAQRVSNV